MQIEVDTKAAQLSLPRGQLISVIVALQLALLLAALDQTVISTAMPHIIAQLGGFDRYAWVTTAYLLTSTCAVPISGKLSDIYGRKPVFIAGLLLFVVASLGCGCASASSVLDGMNALIIFRALQGIAGGAILSLCFIIIGDIFSPQERGKYQGIVAAVFALAALCGPTVGGLVSDIWSWRWLFFINVPVGLLAIIAFVMSFPNLKPQDAKNKIDYLGVFCLIGSLVPLLMGLTEVAYKGWHSVVWLLAISLVMFVAYIVVESRSKHALIPLKLFSNKTVSISCISVFVSGIGMFGSILLLPLFLQSAEGLSAVKSGLFMTPLMVAAAIASIISGQLISRWRYKIVTLFGWVCMAVGVFLLSSINVHTELTTILIYMLICGVGMGILAPIYTVVIQSSVSYDVLGVATSLSQFFRSIGGAVGTAVFSSLMFYLYRRNLHEYLGSRSDLSNGIKRIIESPVELSKVHLGQIIEGVRQALIGSIDSVFFVYGIMIVVVLILNWFLPKDIFNKKTTL